MTMENREMNIYYWVGLVRNVILAHYATAATFQMTQIMSRVDVYYIRLTHYLVKSGVRLLSGARVSFRRLMATSALVAFERLSDFGVSFDGRVAHECPWAA